MLFFAIVINTNHPVGEKFMFQLYQSFEMALYLFCLIPFSIFMQNLKTRWPLSFYFLITSVFFFRPSLTLEVNER